MIDYYNESAHLTPIFDKLSKKGQKEVIDKVISDRKKEILEHFGKKTKMISTEYKVVKNIFGIGKLLLVTIKFEKLEEYGGNNENRN